VIVGSSLNPFHSLHVKTLKETFGFFDLDCDLGFYYSDDCYVGSDVKGRDVILFDNIIRTGQKLRSRVRDLHTKGVGKIYCFAAHGLKPGNEMNRMIDELSITELLLTNSIQQSSEVVIDLFS
jgi:phosphoribosylpyrophosphate synthetase